MVSKKGMVLSLLAALVVLIWVSLVQAESRRPQRKASKRAIELAVNAAPLMARFPFDVTSPLDRGFHFSNGRHLLYAVPVQPGQFYSLGLTFPVLSQEVAITLYDRWPWAPGASRAHLPFPVLGSNQGPLECFWDFGISPHSTGSIVYIALEASSPLDRGTTYLPHTVFISSSAGRTRGHGQQGVHVMEGPRSFQVVASQYGGGSPMAVAAMESEPVSPAHSIPPELLNRPLPGDLLRNSRFQQGLLYWEPSQDPDNRAPVEAAVTDEGLRLWGHEGRGRIRMTQQIGADVRDAKALFLRAQVKISKQTSAGLGTGREAPVAIAVCYQDIQGASHCGQDAFWQGFFILDPPDGKPPLHGRQVSPGLWYQYITDLTTLDPPPAMIKSITLEGAGWPEWTGWVQEVHLLKRSSTTAEAAEGGEAFGRSQ